MPMRQIDFPEKFFAEMRRVKAENGQSFRFQVLTALRMQWGWPVDTMPGDGRVVWQEVSAAPSPVDLKDHPLAPPKADKEHDNKPDDEWDFP